MSEPFIGEIRMFGGLFAPRGWANCEGQLMQISENDALFSLIGTTYGGDGTTTFALPDLRGRGPIHQGTGPGLSPRTIGSTGGAEEVTLTANQLPAHTHELRGTTTVGGQSNAQNAVLAQSPNVSLYLEDPTSSNLAPSAVGSVGGSQPHENRQPLLVVRFIIALFGIYPSPS